jgi:capsular polysaccharide biosynthesis protein
MMEFPAHGEGELYDHLFSVPGTIGIYAVHNPSFTLLCRKNRLPRHTITEEAVYIGGSHNMGHFILDFLPRLEIWCRRRRDRDDLPIYSYNVSGITKEITDTLYPEFRFVNMSDIASEATAFCFDHAHVPSYVPAPFAFPMLRRRAERAGLMKAQSAAAERIYLSRGKKFRRLTNEGELVAQLTALGYTVVDTMEKSFSDIVSIVARAKAVVSCIGAQCIYLVFCPRDTLYVELMPDSHNGVDSAHYNDRLYTHSQVRYRPVSCPTEMEGLIGVKYEWRYSCDIEAVIRALDTGGV